MQLEGHLERLYLPSEATQLPRGPLFTVTPQIQNLGIIQKQHQNGLGQARRRYEAHKHGQHTAPPCPFSYVQNLCKNLQKSCKHEPTFIENGLTASGIVE